jgi:hypothetical protein
MKDGVRIASFKNEFERRLLLGGSSRALQGFKE